MNAALRPYQKSCVRINETQATCEEGEITRQGCNEAHPLVFAWLEANDGKKGRWVLVCLECQCYEELP
jgi:hypothetical protein